MECNSIVHLRSGSTGQVIKNKDGLFIFRKTVPIMDTFFWSQNDSKTHGDKWLNDYNKFTDGKDYYVKIYDVEFNDNYCVYDMEYVNHICPVDEYINIRKLPLASIEKRILYKTIINIINDILCFPKKSMYNSAYFNGPSNYKVNHYWRYKALHLGQILITNDRKYKLIDPDEFNWQAGNGHDGETWDHSCFGNKGFAQTLYHLEEWLWPDNFLGITNESNHQKNKSINSLFKNEYNERVD